MEHEDYMREALSLAREAAQEGEVPVGCVIVKDGGEPVAANAVNNEHATKYQVRSADPENLAASDAFFARFMEEVHKRGMRVIIDGVSVQQMAKPASFQCQPEAKV